MGSFPILRQLSPNVSKSERSKECLGRPEAMEHLFDASAVTLGAWLNEPIDLFKRFRILRKRLFSPRRQYFRAACDPL